MLKTKVILGAQFLRKPLKRLQKSCRMDDQDNNKTILLAVQKQFLPLHALKYFISILCKLVMKVASLIYFPCYLLVSLKKKLLRLVCFGNDPSFTLGAFYTETVKIKVKVISYIDINVLCCTTGHGPTIIQSPLQPCESSWVILKIELNL